MLGRFLSLSLGGRDLVKHSKRVSDSMDFLLVAILACMLRHTTTALWQGGDRSFAWCICNGVRDVDLSVIDVAFIHCLLDRQLLKFLFLLTSLCLVQQLLCAS